MNKEVKLLDSGHVRLDDCMASDLSVINAARVSFAQHSAEMGEREVGLLNFLMRERHLSPFEHSTFRFNIRCPLYVAREWFRHRSASYNEESARYSRIRMDAYCPEPSDIRTQVGKPGAYTFESVSPELAETAIAAIVASYDSAFETYGYLLDELGIAKEVARTVLPQGVYTEFYFTVNARSLMNFISLRNEEHALREIQFYAQVIEDFFAEKMPITHKVFNDNGRFIL